MSILVVCTANVARSPLAEAMLAASVDVEVVSGGTQARDGDTAAVRSQELAVARGLELSQHRSKPVMPDAINAAELVITMSERQRDHCRILVPGAGPKVFTLRELARLLGAVDAPTPAASPAALAERAHLLRPSVPRGWRAEDVHDPIQDPWPAWVKMGASLDEMLTPIVAGLGQRPGWASPTSIVVPDADRTADNKRWWWGSRVGRR